MTGSLSSQSARWALSRLYRQLPARLQRRLFLVIAMMIVGALLDVVSLGAVLPFLAFISAPDRAWNYLGNVGIHSVFGLSRQDDLVYVLAAAFVTLSVLAAAFRTLLGWSLNKYVFAVGRFFSNALLTQTLGQELRYHLTRNTSETISRIQEVRQISINVLQPMLQLASSVTVGVLVVTSLVILSPIVACSALLMIGGVYFLIAILLRARVGANANIMESLRSRRIQIAQEALGGIRDVLLDSSQRVFVKQFEVVDRRISNAQAANNFASTAPRYSVEATSMILITVVAIYYNAQDGGIIASLPILAALAIGAQRLLPQMQQGYAAAIQVSTYAPVANNLLNILETALPREYSGPPPSRALPFTRDITFRDVSFRYASELPPVLFGLDLSIPKGARVGIIGSTGSGKSTTVDLLMGLLTPTGGTIEVDGTCVDGSNRRAWHKAIAHVPQSIYLADATIAANIAFGVPPEDVDMKLVHEAAVKAELASFIEAMPEGYETSVGERGVRLSGGQRQRVGIARAIYKLPAVLILDEGTSALDNKTEAAVMHSIESLDRSLTIVMIAHRLSTIANCDFAVRLENGRIVERFEPSQLRDLKAPAFTG